jgi:glycosyltransferase involved in cell wall biosynthesis
MRDGIVISGDARPGLVGAAQERLSIYLVKDWVYDDADLLGRSPADLRHERDEICSKVDLVLAISPSLKTSLAGVGIAAGVLRHGFHADLVGAYDSPVPTEYATLAQPRIVFAGRIDARLDIDKLVRLARRLPDASIVLIGPVSPRMPADDLAALRGQANVHLIGARRRSALPSYLAHADCLLIPYRDTVWARHGSPLKLWDYLYAGPPIVGSGYSVLSEYLPMVSYANDDERFVAQVADAIANGAGGAAERRAFALANSWDERSHELESMAGEAIGHRAGA